MAKEQSESCPFKSRFQGGWLTAAQYISESICARQAKKQGRELAPLFWKQVYWKRQFLIQLRLAHAMLKLYSQKAIFAALRRAYWVLSLNNKNLDPILQEEQDKLDRQEKERAAKPPPSEPVTPRPTEPVKPRPVYNPEKSLLAKLRSLDAS